MIQGATGAGGVATVVKSLANGLMQQGCHVGQCASSPSEWRLLLSVARRSDVLLATHNFREAYVACAIGALLRKPVVVWFHGPLSEVLAQARAGFAKRLWLRWFYRCAAYFVFVSASSSQSFAQFMQGTAFRSKGLTVIPNALPPIAHPKAPLPPKLDGIVRIGYVGRLSPEKNPHLLIGMLRALPSRFQLTVVGDGPLRSDLEAASADLAQANRIRFLGHRSDIAAFYGTQDLTVLTSLYEGCAMAVLESLQAGVPCVAVPIPSLQEMLQEHAPYLLAETSTAAALAHAVEATLQHPAAELVQDLQKVMGHYQYSDFLQRWHTLLKSTVAAC